MSSEVAADPITRCIIVLSAGLPLYSTDTYQDVYERVMAALESAVPLVNVRSVLRVEPDEDSRRVVVDACFNPMHLVSMYQSHPDV